jgi:5-formaminoimidazole-4-carboxamide-1-(beta)-D-ribofuranosyl 5'-monophosphate synthetase
LSISEKVRELAKDWKNATIGTIGSHSALEIAYGAKQEGFATVVVCQKGREKTYVKYYRKLFDHVLLVDKFADIVKQEIQNKLNDLNTIFVPSRSFSTYVSYGAIEQQFGVPLIGNRFILKTEERNQPKNQYYLLKEAGIPTPIMFLTPQEIDRLVIVKVPEKGRTIERAFFYANSPEEFDRKAEERISKEIITREALNRQI